MRRTFSLLLCALLALAPFFGAFAASDLPMPASLFSEQSLTLPDGYTSLVGMATAPDGAIYAAALSAEGGSALLKYADAGAAAEVIPLTLGENEQIASLDIAPDGKLLASFSTAMPMTAAAPEGAQAQGNAQMGTVAQSGPSFSFQGAPAGNGQTGGGNSGNSTNGGDQMGTRGGNGGGQMMFNMDSMRTTLVWLTPDGAEASRLSVDGFASQIKALTENRVAVASIQGGVSILGPDGSEVSNISAGSVAGIAASASNLFVVGDREITEYEIATGKKLRTAAFDGGYTATAAVGPDGALVIATSLGVYWLRPEDSEISLLMEVTGTYIGDPSNSVAAFARRADGSLVALMSQGGIGAMVGGGGQFMRSIRVSGVAGSANINSDSESVSILAVYTPITASVADRQTFTITALYASTRLQKAVTEFQRLHPEVRVVLQTQMSGQNDSQAAEDHIRTLNTDLLAGKGGDVLVLDGLPVEKYMGKGLLRDLTALLPELGLLPGIEKGSAAADGKVYAVPASFSFDTLWGKKDIVDQVTSLQDLPTLSLPDGQTPLRARNGNSWVELFFPASKAALSTQNSKPTFNTPEFQAFLNTLYDLYSAQGDIANDAMGMRAMRGGISMGEMLALYNGSAALCPMTVGGLMQINIVYSLAGGKDGACIALPSLDGQGRAYTPSLLIGLNTQSKHPTLGEEFLKIVYSADVQEMEQLDGLPAAAKSLDKLFADAIERSEEEGNATIGFAMMGGGGGLQMTMENPDAAAWNALRALCDTLDQPAVSDSTLMDFILAETGTFFDGKSDAATTGNAIQQRAFFYLNE